jgi:hypothetical protein
LAFLALLIASLATIRRGTLRTGAGHFPKVYKTGGMPKWQFKVQGMP